MKKLVFLILGLSLGLILPGFCNAKSEITVTATVLESITYIRTNDNVLVASNTDLGYWKLSDKGNLIIVSKY